MTLHAARALPWGVLGVGVALLAGLVALVQGWPATNWPLQGIAVGVVAATATWCFDEPLAAIVDTTPRHLVWRTVARSSGVAALLVAWLLLVAVTHDGYFGHAVDVAGQGVAAAFAASCYVTWRRASGAATPARAAAAALVGTSAFVALARPFAHRLPLFPFVDADDWAASRVLWLGIAIAGVALLAVSAAQSSRALAVHGTNSTGGALRTRR